MKLLDRLEQTLQPASFPIGILDEYPEDEVRAIVDAGMAGEFQPILRAWLHTQELRRAARALAAAERSARASEKAARFAMWAAIISLVGIIVALTLN